MASEGALARHANRVLLSATDLITTTLWSDYYFGACPEWVRRAAEARANDLYLLTDIDVPRAPAPRRDCGHLREHFRGGLARRGRRYVSIHGS